MVDFTDKEILQELNHALRDHRLTFVGDLQNGCGIRLSDVESVAPLRLEGAVLALVNGDPVPGQDPPPTGVGSFGPHPDERPEYTVRCTEAGAGAKVEIYFRDPASSEERRVAQWRCEFLGGTRDLDAARIAAIAVARRQIDY